MNIGTENKLLKKLVFISFDLYYKEKKTF